MWKTDSFTDTISLKEKLQKKGVIMNIVANITQDIVLIVEDTVANHEVIRTFLNDINVRCESAFDGMEAVTRCSLVEKNYYSLILMDINLPKMNGFQTATKLRSLGMKAPIIAITASSKDDARLAGARGLFDAFLFKPFNSSEFLTAISPYVHNALQYSLAPNAMQKKEDSTPAVDPQICDVQRAVDNMGGSFRLFEKHFNNFKRNNADLAFRMESLVQQNHFPECSVLCHSIKGLSGMLGLTALYEHMIALEECLNKMPAPPAQGEDAKNGAAQIGNVQNDMPQGKAMQGKARQNNTAQIGISQGEDAQNETAQGKALQHKICELLPAIKNDIRLVCKVQV